VIRLLRKLTRDFWAWYERHYTLNVSIAVALFALQVVHLCWLTGEPLWTKLFEEPLFTLDGPAQWLIVLVDYTEIPALISVSLVYLHDLRSGFRWRPVMFLVLLNSQWLHLFWITDEFVAQTDNGSGTSLPAWLAYVAILIDYLELPVMFDTIRKLISAMRRGEIGVLLRKRAPSAPGEREEAV